MNKSLLVGMLALSLTACSPTIDRDDTGFILPPDLQHCRVVTLSKGSMSSQRIFLIKCPEGYMGTSYTNDAGKHTASGSVHFD